jgi:predicted double-glycine peptidase
MKRRPQRVEPLVLALALVLVLAGAAPSAGAGPVTLPFQIGGDYAVPVTSLKEARYMAMVRQQYDFSCGSAALSTLLTYHYGVPVSEQLVFEAMFALGDQEKIRQEGFSLLDMKRYLEGRGFAADGYEASVDKLSAAGIPAIVLINDQGYNHFVVVKGLREGRVLLGDPAGGTRVVSRQAFESMWVNGILFVISSHKEAAVFNRPSDWRVDVRAPLANGINRDGVAGLVMPKFGAGDF